jgi:hypothetical protein
VNSVSSISVGSFFSMSSNQPMISPLAATSDSCCKGTRMGIVVSDKISRINFVWSLLHMWNVCEFAWLYIMLHFEINSTFYWLHNTFRRFTSILFGFVVVADFKWFESLSLSLHALSALLFLRAVIFFYYTSIVIF